MISENSILNDIKLLCGLPEEIKDFDTIITLHINTVFSTLAQLGLASGEMFYITDDTWVWSDVIDPMLNLHNVKSYVYLKVKLLFDPPANATLVNSMESQAKELEWRIKTEIENLTEEVMPICMKNT